MTKLIKLKRVRIDVVNSGTHIFAGLIKLFDKKSTGQVFSVNCVQEYSDGSFIIEKGINLMIGDSVTFDVIREK